jgi:hypothetical protein
MATDSAPDDFIPVPIPMTGGELGKCKSCGSPVVGKFCSECGQRSNVKRITLREGWNDFWSRVYGFDGMFPRTLRDMTLRPGHASRTYIKGNRVMYYGPVGYFFLMITLYLLVMSILSIDPLELTREIASGVATPKPGSGQDKFNTDMAQWINDNQRLVSFVFIPCQVLWLVFLFRKSALNFLEHSVMVLYLNGHFQWISIIFLFVFKFTGYFLDFSLLMLLQFVYFCFGCVQLYDMYKPFSAVVRAFFSYVLYWISLFLVITAVMVVVIALNPELVEQLRPSSN